MIPSILPPTPHCTQLTEELRASIVIEAASEVESWFSRLDCLVVGLHWDMRVKLCTCLVVVVRLGTLRLKAKYLPGLLYAV